MVRHLPKGGLRSSGVLIVNADDWGRDRLTTDRAHHCTQIGAVSSVSAMVFMDDSERAAAIARDQGIEAGLHLNLTAPFTGSGGATRLREHQDRLARYLLRYWFSQSVFHTGLVQAFDYVVASQLDEFRRLYGTGPDRIDGHHHMHLCANVLLAGLLPPGTLVRRSFSFQPGEKSFLNRFYRRVVDHILSRRHRLVDFFFSLAPLEPSSRLQRMCSLAREFVVEAETHPIESQEYRFLTEGQMFRLGEGIRIAPPSAMPGLRAPRNQTRTAYQVHRTHEGQ